MDRLFLPLLGALVLIASGFGSAWAWDRHPPVGFHVKLLVWKVGYDLPDSLLVERDNAYEAARLARVNEGRCNVTLGKQNTEIARLGQASARLTGSARAAVRQAQPQADVFTRMADSLRATHLREAEDCLRFRQADAAVLEALR